MTRAEQATLGLVEGDLEHSSFPFQTPPPLVAESSPTVASELSLRRGLRNSRLGNPVQLLFWVGTPMSVPSRLPGFPSPLELRRVSGPHAERTLKRGSQLPQPSSCSAWDLLVQEKGPMLGQLILILRPQPVGKRRSTMGGKEHHIIGLM